MLLVSVILPFVSFACVVKLGESLLASRAVLRTTTLRDPPGTAVRCIGIGMSSIDSTPSCVRVQVISDFACPWCYVGKARLNGAMEAFSRSNPDAKVEVSFRPYMIDPRTQPGGEDYLAYTERRWGGDGWTTSLKRSSRKDGCEFASWETWPNTLLAHRLQKFAEQAGKGDEVNSLVFQTIYERGGNASDLETLADLAAEAGLSRTDARAYLASRDGEDAVLRDDSDAKTRLNVRGVPYFVVRNKGGDGGGDGGGDKKKVVLNGAVGPDELLRAFSSFSS